MNPRSALDSHQLDQEQFNIAKQQKWYLKWWSVIVWLATIGPFGLPFLWKSKDFSLFWKWFLTLAIIALTIMLSWGTWKIIKLTIEQFKNLGLV